MEQMDKAEQNLAELERIAKELHKSLRIGTIGIGFSQGENLEYIHYATKTKYTTREYILAKLRKWEVERVIKWLT